mmetsp:Transcript_15718/g.19606  ORF Transcript_15718/g.19606 Transcript_15718/m.19606 type:complete len:84 (-) Transcript_15718:85-336(-)
MNLLQPCVEETNTTDISVVTNEVTATSKPQQTTAQITIHDTPQRQEKNMTVPHTRERTQTSHKTISRPQQCAVSATASPTTKT